MHGPPHADQLWSGAGCMSRYHPPQHIQLHFEVSCLRTSAYPSQLPSLPTQLPGDNEVIEAAGRDFRWIFTTRFVRVAAAPFAPTALKGSSSTYSAEASPNSPLLMTEVELNIQPSLGGFGKLPAFEHRAFIIAPHQEALASTPGAEHAVPCVLCVNPHFWRQHENGLDLT